MKNISFKGIERAWPDLPHYSSVSFSESFGVSVDLAPVLRRLDIRLEDAILDIGAFKNETVESLQEQGFYNAVGLDVNHQILSSKFGRQGNFRDISTDEKYKVIYFSQFIDHLPGGNFNTGMKPKLTLFAMKIWHNLLPGGYLIFSERANNVPELVKALLRTGFILISSEKGLYIFKKGE